MYHFQTTHIEVSDDEIEALEEASQSPGQAPPSPDYIPDPKHPPSPDYVPGPEEPEQAPLSPVSVLEPEYLEYLVPSNDEAPIEDQPLHADASLTALSPGDDDDDSSDDVDENDDDQEEE
ncbi:hypothetical protein Tco_0781762 [Tanacetum coccineum]